MNDDTKTPAEPLPPNGDERKQADELRKSQQWAAAAELYRKLWEAKEQAWDGYFWAHCLRKSGDSAASLDATRVVFAKHRDHKPLRNHYALCIYDLEIKQLNQIRNEDRVFKALSAIKELSEPPEKIGDFNLVNVAVWKVVKIYKERINFAAEAMLKLTDLLDPDAQDNDCYVTEDEDGKKVELASKREEYYMLRSKALYELKRYEECVECCNQALSKLDKFHYDNDVWFKMRIARVNAESGDVAQAIQQLETLLSKRREWFLQRDLAEWHLKTGNDDKALKYILDAVLNHGDPDKKISVYKAAVNIFSRLEREDDAKRIVEFIAAVYNDVGKKFDAETAELLQKYDVSQDRNADLKKEFKALKRRCEEMLAELVPRFSGTIKRINPDGFAGFIETGDKKSYFFKLKDVNGKKEDVVPGAEVTFVAEKGFDKKKNKESDVAVKIQLKNNAPQAKPPPKK